MKCVRNIKDKSDEIIRVSDEEAAALVKKGWMYCPKWRWKAATRST